MMEPSDEPTLGLLRQMEIYRDGMAGRTPEHPVSMEALESKAKSVLDRAAYDYLAGGAGSEDTMRANREAFRRWRIVPRFLRDVGRRDLGVEILGTRFPMPVMLAPIGVLSIIHREADLAVARAAGSLGVPLIVSTAASTTIEDVAAAMGEAPRWFQLYWSKDDELAASFLHRAERAGYSAIVVTIDTFLLGWRERDLDNAYLPFLNGDGLANYFSDPVFQQRIGGEPRAHPAKALEYFLRVFSDPTRTWSDFERLRAVTRLPILVKGVVAPDDARRAIDHGAAGVIVSNHGGRQLDGAIGAIDALPAVVKAIGDRATVLFDSGIRRGSDIFKALALGARSTLVGRPYCYGLALGGEKGVRDVITNLVADFDLTLGLAGYTSCKDVERASLIEVTDLPASSMSTIAPDGN
jgi:isopentenyl diphosphate isomerase/L-lactate dehydrogenase-like FMN-dependent dehydrogenase